MMANDIFETKKLISQPTVRLAAEKMLSRAWRNSAARHKPNGKTRLCCGLYLATEESTA
jgi:hypothetical protein